MAAIGRWLSAFGYRNVAYLGCLAVLMLLASAFPPGSPSQLIRAAWFFVMMNWAAVSLLFFAVNAVLVVVDLANGRSPLKPLIACALPILFIIVPALIFGEIAPVAGN